MFKRLKINEERELEHLIIKDPECIEKGMKYLTHQRENNGKFIDVLAVDADGILTIVELKLDQEDEMLFQALEYYDYVSSNRDRLANEFEKRAKIERSEEPRIILIASEFSERIRRAVRYFAPQTTLMEYAYLETKTGERGLFCQEVHFDAEDVYTPPVSFEDALSYIHEPKAREACEKVFADLRRIGKDIEALPKRRYVIFKWKNRQVGSIDLKRGFIHVWVKDLDGNWVEGATISSPKDWSSKKEKVLGLFTRKYRSLGGE